MNQPRWVGIYSSMLTKNVCLKITVSESYKNCRLMSSFARFSTIISSWSWLATVLRSVRIAMLVRSNFFVLKAEAEKAKAGSLQLQQEVVLLRGQLATEQQKTHRQNWDDVVGENTKLRSDVKTLNDQKLEIEKLFRRYKGKTVP